MSDIVTHCILTHTMHSELSVTCSCHGQLAEQWMESSPAMLLNVDTRSLHWEQDTEQQEHTVGMKWTVQPFFSLHQPLVTDTGYELHIHTIHHLRRLHCAKSFHGQPSVMAKLYIISIREVLLYSLSFWTFEIWLHPHAYNSLMSTLYFNITLRRNTVGMCQHTPKLSQKATYC